MIRESRRLASMQRRFPIILVLLMTVGGGLLWAGYIALTRYSGAPPSSAVEVMLGQSHLRLDSAYLRHQEDRDGGRPNELAIAASFDSFRPALAAGPLRPGMPLADPNVIVITLRPADPALDPAERTAKLYARFLESETWSHPGGLIMRRFRQQSPYANEELYIAPPDGRRFAARCTRPMQSHDGLPDTCVAETRLENLDINIRFASNLLVDWDKLVLGAQGLVLSMRR